MPRPPEPTPPPRLGDPSPRAPSGPSTPDDPASAVLGHTLAAPCLGGPFTLAAPRLGGPFRPVLWDTSDLDTAARASASMRSELDALDNAISGFLAAAVQRFGTAALDVIDLPSLDDPAEPAPLELAGALLYLRETEAAGMPSFIEAVGAAVAEGRLEPTADQGLRELLLFNRDAHPASAERAAAFERVFADGFDAEFDRFARLLADASTLTPEAFEARSSVAAQQLAETLAPRISEYIPFFTREAAARLRQAMRLAETPTVHSLFGPGSVWAHIGTHGAALLGHPVELRRKDRAVAGRELLRTVARLRRPGTLRHLEPVMSAAQRWLLCTPSEAPAS